MPREPRRPSPPAALPPVTPAGGRNAQLQAIVDQLEKLAGELSAVQLRSHANARAIVEAQQKLRTALDAVRHTDPTSVRRIRKRKPARRHE